MATNELPLFVVGQVWQCRHQGYSGQVYMVENEGRYCHAKIRDRTGELMHDFNYDRNRTSIGMSYSVSRGDQDSSDMMLLLFCPSWGGEAPDANR